MSIPFVCTYFDEWLCQLLVVGVIVIELTRYLTNNLNIELDIEYDARQLQANDDLTTQPAAAGNTHIPLRERA